MSLKIKICGFRRSEDIHYANLLKPDFVGFIFAESKRKVFPETAEKMKKELCPEIKSVGVFADAPAEHIASLADAGIIDLIQLHGGESAEYTERLRKMTDKPIIRVLEYGKRLDGYADYILYDLPKKTSAKKSFDVNLLIDKELPSLSNTPVFFAGGLDKHNIRYLLKTKAFGADICGGTENPSGFKDYEKMKEIIELARNYNV